MKPPRKKSKSRLSAHRLQLVSEGLRASRHLDAVAEKIRTYRRGEAASVVMHQFAVGRIVLALEEDPKHGDTAIQRLAFKLKCSPKSLYRVSTLAKAFPPEFVNAALAKAAANNFSLRVSIFDAVVGVEDESNRFRLVEDAIRARLKIRQPLVRAWGMPAGPSNRPAGILTPRILGRAEALVRVLKAVLASKRETDPRDRDRVLAALMELKQAIDDASRYLTRAEVFDQISRGLGDKTLVDTDRPNGGGAS